jgi:type VI secretion system protein ImpH
LAGRSAVPDDTFLFYSGLLARQLRTATGLEQILAEYFGWPVRVEQLHGQWFYLDADNRAVLPAGGGLGANTNLGRTW